MLQSFGMVSEKEIKKLEKRLKITLPDDYRDFLTQHNGGCPADGLLVFPVEGIEEQPALDMLFGIGRGDDLSIKDWCDEFKCDLLDDMIIIGHAIETGMLLLVNQEDWKGIYFWDDALDYEQSTEEECIYKVADSFEEFMSILSIFEED